jgi:hypothetical protein
VFLVVLVGEEPAHVCVPHYVSCPEISITFGCSEYRGTP